MSLPVRERGCAVSDRRARGTRALLADHSAGFIRSWQLFAGGVVCQGMLSRLDIPPRSRTITCRMMPAPDPHPGGPREMHDE